MTNDLIYIAMPYSHHDKRVVENRMDNFLAVDSVLSERGYLTISPVMKHQNVIKYGMKGDYSMWGRLSRKLLSRSDLMLVIKMPGWKESVGVQDEISLAKQIGIPLVILSPATILNKNANLQYYFDLAKELQGATMKGL